MSGVPSDQNPAQPFDDLPHGEHGIDQNPGSGSIHDPEPIPSEETEAAVDARPKRPAKGASRLGLLAMVLGIAACVLCRQALFPPSMRISPTPLAVAGLVLAFLALGGILVGSRARAGLPFLAILLCLTAISVTAYQNGVRDVGSTRAWANQQVKHYGAELNQLRNRAAPPASQTPANGGPGQPIPGSPAPQIGQPAGVSQSGTPANAGGVGGAPARPGGADAGIGAGSIFDMRPGSPGSSSGGNGATALPASPPAVTAGPGNSSPPPPVVPGAGGTNPFTPRILSARAAVLTARAKLNGIENNFRASYAATNDPQYLSASDEVEAANKLVDEAKRRSDGFGQPLIDATRQRKEAQEKVARIVNDAMARDPAVAASRRELAAAEDALRQAYGAARSAK